MGRGGSDLRGVGLSNRWWISYGALQLHVAFGLDIFCGEYELKWAEPSHSLLRVSQLDIYYPI